jgi:toxin ParE1/3/4
MVQVSWTKKALRDLREIYEFIARDSDRYAQMQVERIRNMAGLLAEYPRMGRSLEEFPESSYRQMIVDQYRVIYRLASKRDRILIMSVVHGRRLYGK